ncbi:pentatricopeptide repeat-containing family protein [Striga asiatica]|uniref:Pentatricopeptide repeat-containing family protein n=1 Tax=Striga asiatica TaxID=4170 RepID=A0A5A7PY45_STRAF|nr:pentatricopeptide repeat-containing family protein [Striga asiatica]
MQVLKLKTLLDNPLTVDQAKQIHCQIILNRLRNLEPLLVRQTLKSASTHSPRATRYAASILRRMPTPDASATSHAIRHLSQRGHFADALSLYRQSLGWGLPPTTFAVSSALKACARIPSKIGGPTIHGQALKIGLCSAIFVQTALVDFYSKLGDMGVARKVFDEITTKNIVSWNSLLAGHVRSGDLSAARAVFDEIPDKDVISWNSIVSAYARAKKMDQAYEIFRIMPQKSPASWNTIISAYVECGNIELARSFFDAMPERNSVCSITLISAYSKLGDVESAEKVHEQLPVKDLLSYNAMIACYAQNNRPKEALQLFEEMRGPLVGLEPDKMTLASAVSACSQLGDLDYGNSIELYMKELGISMDNHIATAFIDLYAKCGEIERAYGLFNALRKKDLVAYTAIILGCGLNGQAREAIGLFEEMMSVGIVPNPVTFTGILTAYNHVGMVEEGYRCFLSMRENGLSPSPDHYAIVVDLLGRAGRLEEAHEVIKSMPMKPHAGVWGALLKACSLHDDVELAEIAARNCFELEPEGGGRYSLLAGVYASSGKWDEANRLRADIDEKGILKIRGSSLME